MSDRSANLSLPFILPSQAQKHVTHNEALIALDALVQLGVASATTPTPPPDPDDGDRYIVPDAATGPWAGQTGTVAVWDATGWIFLPPREGWSAWVADAGLDFRFVAGAWTSVAEVSPTYTKLGVNASADAVNRLSVSSDATLLTHDGAGHQLKLNKAGAGDTASLLFQTGWSGRAEIGLIGDDSLALKVSPDGSAFIPGLLIAAETGVVDFPQGATGLSADDLGSGGLATMDALGSRRSGLVTNGAGHLLSLRNVPAGATLDREMSPDLPSSFSFAGHYAGDAVMSDPIPVDPAECYRMRCYARQESVAGDWSAYAQEERHQQGIGLMCYDPDGLLIEAHHHSRFRSGGLDSHTTLAAPLAPGDLTVVLTNASGWNDTDPAPEVCGLILFGYRDTGGRRHAHYSRLVQHGLFSPAGVSKTTHVITLDAPLPAALANPDDAGGVWPAGTPLANTAAGLTPRLCLLDHGILPATDTWFRIQGHIGGVDQSGTGMPSNFAPGTAFVRPVFLPNQSNRLGGWNGHPDTGTGQRIWFGGMTLTEAPLALATPVQSGSNSGSHSLLAPYSNSSTGQVEIAAALTVIMPV